MAAAATTTTSFWNILHNKVHNADTAHSGALRSPRGSPMGSPRGRNLEGPKVAIRDPEMVDPLIHGRAVQDGQPLVPPVGHLQGQQILLFRLQRDSWQKYSETVDRQLQNEEIQYISQKRALEETRDKVVQKLKKHQADQLEKYIDTPENYQNLSRISFQIIEVEREFAQKIQVIEDKRSRLRQESQIAKQRLIELDQRIIEGQFNEESDDFGADSLSYCVSMILREWKGWRDLSQRSQMNESSVWDERIACIKKNMSGAPINKEEMARMLPAWEFLRHDLAQKLHAAEERYEMHKNRVEQDYQVGLRQIDEAHRLHQSVLHKCAEDSTQAFVACERARAENPNEHPNRQNLVESRRKMLLDLKERANAFQMRRYANEQIGNRQKSLDELLARRDNDLRAIDRHLVQLRRGLEEVDQRIKYHFQ
jgi:hypothetical protein